MELGHYRVLKKLGEGGMGSVYAARDLSSSALRLVALKTTKQQGDDALKVLFDEARIASRLHHGNVCTVHEMAQDGDVHYLVLDYCDGVSLYDWLLRIEHHRLAPHVAVKLCAMVAAGLHAAHGLTDDTGARLGVVHRDVSPQNVLVSTTGQVWLADFGVAKALGQAHRATETGEFKGKVSYMAPEQVRSKDIDCRADVFALACVLFQSVAGTRPFAGDSTVSVLYQLLEEEVPLPTDVWAGFPPSLEPIVMRALSKERDERYADARAFQEALEGWLMESGTFVTEEDLAAALRDTYGDSLQRAHADLLERARDERSVESAGLAEFKPSDVLDSTPPGTSLSNSQDGAPKVVDSPRPRSPVALTLAAVAAVGVSLLVWRLGSGAPHPEAQASAADGGPTLENEPALEEASPPPEPAPRLHRLSISASPASTEIRLDGERLGEGKFEGELPASNGVRELRLSADGYESKTVQLSLDRDRLVEFELRRMNPEPPSTPRPPAVAHPTPTQASEVPPKPTPRPVARTPRQLDSDNPFAD